MPPHGSNVEDILEKLSNLNNLSFHGFSVASNPVAKSKMSAMVFTHLIQTTIKKPAILHCTIRDHNRLGLQSELWGAKALGIDTVIWDITQYSSLRFPEDLGCPKQMVGVALGLSL